MVSKLALAFIGVSFMASAAHAAISVQRAEYKGGVLVLSGKTSQPHTTVTLDGTYKARSDSERSFQFRIRYRPSNCTVRLQSGVDIFHARLSQCQRRSRSGRM